MWDKILAVLLLASSAGAYTVQGNLTVTGGGLTVGTSSFTVAGGSATVAYQMAAGSFSGAATGLTGINGPSISLSTIPLAALAPNGAALNQVVGYNGSGWSPQTLGTISTVGITSACAAGYFLSTATYSNGLVESGGCVSVSALQGNIGGQLTVGSTLTVQGSAFSVGGSTFSILYGTVTENNLIVNGSVYFASQVSTLSYTVNFTSTTSNTVDGMCVPGSTISFRSNGKIGTFTFSGYLFATGAATSGTLSPVVDGVLATQPTYQFFNNATVAAGQSYFISQTILPQSHPLTAGLHTACLAMTTGSSLSPVETEDNTFFYHEDQ